MSSDSPAKSLLSKRLNPDDPTPLYYQIYSLLKQDILNGTLENGVQLPTELGLSSAYNISRITAKRALNELANEGLVQRRRAKGTHVTHVYEPKPVKAPLVGMLQEIESMARHSEARVLEVVETRPPAEICDEFGLGPGETVLKMVRVRSRDDEPFSHYVSWSLGLKHHIDKKILETTPRLEVFRKNGVEIGRVKQILSAEGASSEVATELQVDPGFPLLSMTRRSFDEHERLIDYLHALYHPDRFQYHMELTPEKLGAATRK